MGVFDPGRLYKLIKQGLKNIYNKIKQVSKNLEDIFDDPENYMWFLDDDED